MIPQDFSYQLPARCLALLNALENQLPSYEGGPLRTTFLLALAMPLLTIPHQVINGNGQLVMRDVNRLRRDVAPIMNAPFADAPFRAGPGEPKDAWYYLRLPPANPRHPRELEIDGNGLRSGQYAEVAEAQRTGFVLHQVRNALAHAGVIYLDEEGRYEPEREARMLAFIAEIRENRNVVGYSALGVMENDFSAFLRRWARWLQELGLDRLALGA